MLHSQVLRTVASSARKTFAAEDRHSVDFRGMVNASVEPYRCDYWSILTTLIITGLHYAEPLSIWIKAEVSITRLRRLVQSVRLSNYDPPAYCVIASVD